VDMEFDRGKEEEEFKNSMQSSMASARWESIMGSETERDLTKDEETSTLREDLLLMEINRMALTTLACRRCRNLTGENPESFGSRKVHIPMTLFLPPETLVPPPCLRNIVGLSFTSGLKLTLLLAFLDI
jgi:hypothetical protein